MKRDMQRMVLIALAALAIGFLCCPVTKAHAGASPWEAVSLSVGLQERWLTDSQPPASDGRQLEAAGNAALGLTPHVTVTGGLAVGLQDSYVRGHADARIVATDAKDPDFAVWLGAGRYFSKHVADGLDEWAAKAGLGWHPVKGKPDADGRYVPSPLMLGLTVGRGLNTSRGTLTLSGTFSFKAVKGGS